MSEVTVGDRVFRIGRLNAKIQFDLLRRLGPALPVFWQERRDDSEQIDGARWLLGFTSGALADMKQADSDYVLDTCLSVVEMRSAGDASRPVWAKVWTAGRMMFEDIDVMTMMELVDAVIQQNLESFFARLRVGSAPTTETAQAVAVQ